PSLGVYVIGGLIAVGLALLFWRHSRPTPKTLVFLSSGGTCRDPMAKAITTKLFEAHKQKFPVTIRAAGLGPLDKNEASFAARSVIREMYGEDLLADHKPELLSTKLATQADLILAMDESLLKAQKALSVWRDAYNGKLYVLKPFFGLEGDVVDPWSPERPDGRDQETLDRSKRCADELRGILTQHFDRLVRALHV